MPGPRTSIYPVPGKRGSVRTTALLTAGLLAGATVTIPVEALAQAQASPPPSSLPNAQQLNPAQLAQPKPRQSDDVFAAPAPGPCPMAASSLKFTLASVRFSGAEGVRNLDLSQAYRGMVGRTLSLQDVCDIRDRAADLLFRAGVLARVDIPEQTIASGQLTLAVTTAHVVAVYVKGDAGQAKDKVADYIEKLRGMKPFDLRQAQRYLLLASDVPGVRVQASLRPSAGTEPGAVDFYVYVSYQPVTTTVSVQNTGSKALGPDSVLGRVDFNGLTPWGDKTSLILYTTTDLREQTVAQAVEEARVGNEGWLVRGSVSYGKTEPGDTLKALGLVGTSWVTSLEADYPIIRARRRNLSLALGFDAVEQKLDVTGANLSNDKLRVLHLALSGFQSWQPASGGWPTGFVSAGMEIRQGLNGFGASKAGQTNLSRFDAQPDATVERFNARLDLRVNLVSLDMVGQYQTTNKVLLTYEDFVVGNLTIGRGYDPSALEGDRGYGLSTELGVGPFAIYRPQRGYGVAASVFTFYDLAHVDNLSQGGIRRTVHSTGVGVRADLGRSYRLEVTYAHPQDDPNPNDNPPHRPSDRVLVTLTARF